MADKISRFVKSVWETITIEPVVLLFCIISSLSKISSEVLYLQKGCQVNLGVSASVCLNLTAYNQTQLETQKLVSGVQAYNGLLQSLPAIVFTLFAGPLSDTYGRKPFLVVAIFGYVVQNLVFLVNAFWFHQLQVEYMLFECLQDVLGGRAGFFLAVNSYLVDITSENTRTARFAFLEVFFCVGVMLGNPIGTLIQASFGFVALFTINTGLSLATMLYVVVFIKDSIELVSEDRRAAIIEERNKNKLNHDQGIVTKVVGTVLSNFKTIIRTRPHRTRLLVFVMIYTIPLLAKAGRGATSLMFYRKQYKISSVTYSLLFSVWALSAFLSELFLLPFLSLTLRLRDTTIVLLTLVTSIVGYLIEAFSTQVWVLFFSWSVFQMLWANTLITTMSALSKLLEPTEIGKMFCLLGLAKALMKMIGKPLFSLLYKATVEVNPSLCLFVVVLIQAFVLGLVIFNHVATIRDEKREDTDETAVEIK